jgi:hypothetical protein
MDADLEAGSGLSSRGALRAVALQLDCFVAARTPLLAMTGLKTGLSQHHSIERRFDSQNESTERWSECLMSLRSVDLNSLWTGRFHVQRLGVKPHHLQCIDPAQKKRKRFFLGGAG